MSIINSGALVTNTNGLGMTSNSTVSKTALSSPNGDYTGTIDVFSDSSDANAILVRVQATAAMTYEEPNLGTDANRNDVINMPYTVDSTKDNTRMQTEVVYKFNCSSNPFDAIAEWELFTNVDHKLDSNPNNDKQQKYKFTKTSTRPW